MEAVSKPAVIMPARPQRYPAVGALGGRTGLGAVAQGGRILFRSDGEFAIIDRHLLLTRVGKNQHGDWYLRVLVLIRFLD